MRQIGKGYLSHDTNYHIIFSTYKADLLIDGVQAQSFHKLQHGFQVKQPTRSTLLILLPTLQHEIELDFAVFDLTIRAPYSLYSGKLEGLCGKIILKSSDFLKNKKLFFFQETVMEMKPMILKLQLGQYPLMMISL